MRSNVFIPCIPLILLTSTCMAQPGVSQPGITDVECTSQYSFGNATTDGFEYQAGETLAIVATITWDNTFGISARDVWYSYDWYDDSEQRIGGCFPVSLTVEANDILEIDFDPGPSILSSNSDYYYIILEGGVDLGGDILEDWEAANWTKT